MKNKDVIVGISIIAITSALMILTLYYVKNNLSKKQPPTHVNIIIDKKDPKFKIKNWGMNRTRTQKEWAIERMMRN